MATDTHSTWHELQPTITIGGTESADLGTNLLALMVEEVVEGLCRCEIRLSNWSAQGGQTGYHYTEQNVLDFGRQIAVTIGSAGQQAQELFRGRIMGLEGVYPAGGSLPQLVVLAEDELQNLRMTRRSRTFADMTDSAIIALVAEEHQLQTETRLSATETAHELVVQANQSDLAFIRERARHIGAALRLDGSTLIVEQRVLAQTAALRLRYGQELTHFTVLADLAHQRTQVHVTGWDAANKQAIHAATGSAVLQGELAGGISGSALLQMALGEREDYIVHQVPLGQAEAQAISASRYLARARGFVRGTGAASGDARLRAGMYVELSGLGSMFDGTYYVTRAQHRFDRQRGYTVEFDAERPTIGQRRAVQTEYKTEYKERPTAKTTGQREQPAVKRTGKTSSAGKESKR